MDGGPGKATRRRVWLVASVAAIAALALLPSAGHAAVNCSDFSSQAAAQAWFLANGGPASDPEGLDADHDGIACESLPCPCNYSTTPTPPAPPPPPPPSLPPPPADGDRDGVPDLTDHCPSTPAGTAVDANGCPIPPPAPSKHTSVRVHRVVDGDTLKVKMRSGAIRTVRLIGIDTPETVDPGKPTECGGPQATKAMTKLAMRHDHGKLVGRAATLVSDPTQDAKDRYGRTLGYIEIAGKDIGRRMIRSGWSPAYVFRDPFRRLGTYTAAENAAKAEGRGVWSMCGGNFHRAR